MTQLKNILEGHWEEIKGKVKTKWAKLTDQDLEKIDGSYKQLSGKLQKIYGYTAAEAEDEISEFFDSDEFDRIKRKTENKLNEIKDVVINTLDEYFQKAKQKSFDAEQAVIAYATENPCKVFGMAALTGLVVGYLCSKK